MEDDIPTEDAEKDDILSPMQDFPQKAKVVKKQAKAKINIADSCVSIKCVSIKRFPLLPMHYVIRDIYVDFR